LRRYTRAFICQPPELVSCNLCRATRTSCSRRPRVSGPCHRPTATCRTPSPTGPRRARCAPRWRPSGWRRSGCFNRAVHWRPRHLGRRSGLSHHELQGHRVAAPGSAIPPQQPLQGRRQGWVKTHQYPPEAMYILVQIVDTDLARDPNASHDATHQKHLLHLVHTRALREARKTSCLASCATTSCRLEASSSTSSSTGFP
jgi:hypothetical protein